MLFKRIKDWATSITAFRSDDVIPVDGSSGTAKMNVTRLMELCIKIIVPEWHKAYSYPAYSIVQRNNNTFQAKHRIDYNTEFSSDDWDQVDLSSLNRNTVHLSGNNIRLDEKTIKGCYIGLGNVGETISLDYVNNVSYDCLKIPVKKGYKFQFKGQGGITPRLWGIVDNELKICQVANENQYQGNYGNIVSNQDGFLIFNANNSSTYSLIFSPFDAETIEVLSNYIENIKYKIDLLQYSNEGQYIPLGGLNVGDSVDIENFASSSTYNGIIIPVKEGDLVEIKGNSGNAPRLWCITDATYTIKSLSSANYYSNKLTTLLVKEDGFFIGSYDKTSLDYEAEVNLISTNNRILDIVSTNVSSILKNNGISLNSYLIDGLFANCRIGSSVIFNGNVSFRTLMYPCKKGDIFEIRGAGGNDAPLYSFTDVNGIVTDVSAQALVISLPQYVVAPNDGFFIYNSYTNAESSVNYNCKNFGSISKIVNKDKLQKFDLKSIATPGLYIDLNYNVGDTVEETLYDSNDYSFVIIPVKYGDIIQINKVSSGSKPRLWCITDSNKKVLKIASSSQYYSSTYSIFIESNGFAYLDYKDYSGTSEITFVGTQDRINTIIQSSYLASKSIVKNENICIENKSFIELKCVNTSGATADLNTLVTNKNIRILIMNCNVGDKFIVTGHGATAYRLWAFVDNNGNVVSKSDAVIVLNGKEVISPINGKFVMQSFVHSAPTEYKLLTNNKEFVQSQLNKTQDEAFKLCKFIPGFCDFGKSYDLRDYETDISTFDFSGNMLDQVQNHFDGLLTNNQNYISRVDIYEELGEEYPQYATYKTYMYKLEGDLDGMGNLNGRHPKKKVFIVAGIHGDEIAAPVNAYLFAKNLCNIVDDTYFKLRSSCNFYIIPCVNGYGMINNQRDNGNGVDINRNFPIAAWTEDGAGTSQYTGPSACSESETKIVVGAFNMIKPDIGLDHHNYGNTSYQLYGVCSSEEVSNIFYNAFTECSYAFIKNFPEYFGNKFRIFNNPAAPKVLGSYENPTTNRWMFEQGLVDGCTCEISNNVNFVNGETHIGTELQYAPIVWSIGEFTLKNVIVKLVQHVINKEIFEKNS